MEKHDFKIITITYFDKQFKYLAKKYPSLKNELINLVTELKSEPDKGTPIGRNCYKIRLAISSKGKGKSGGARVISYIKITETSVFLLSIYDKSEKENIDDKELIKLLNSIK